MPALFLHSLRHALARLGPTWRAAPIQDPPILRLIRLWLRAGVMHEGVWEESVVGTPHGGVISPLLSNIYLHPLDLYWERQMGGAKMVRYADDLVVLCRRGGARRSMPVLRRFLARLKLTVNGEKTRVVSAPEGLDLPRCAFPEAADAARQEAQRALRLAIAPGDAADTGQGAHGHRSR